MSGMCAVCGGSTGATCVCLRSNENGWTIYLRTLPDLSKPELGGGIRYGPMVVYRPEEWPPPAVILIDLDCDDIPPLPTHVKLPLKIDSGMRFFGKVPGMEVEEPTVAVAKRCFRHGRDPYTGLRMWLEVAPIFVDEPAD